MTKEELEYLIFEKKLSYEKIGKLFNVSGTAIKKRAKKLGIKLQIKRTTNENETFNKNITLIDKINDENLKKIVNESKSIKEIFNKIGYSNIKNRIKIILIKRCEKMNINLDFLFESKTSKKTKGELFYERKNWQSARSYIQKTAREFFFKENKCPKCYVCGYDKHVEVAHIKSVSSFSDETLISEINSKDNLIGLCPNHHWEYDNGILDLK